MILLRVDDKIQFTPESNTDCFNLGGLAQRVSCTVIFNKGQPIDTDIPTNVSWIEVKQSDLLAYLFK